MAENLVLTIFLLLPAALGIAVYRFFSTRPGAFARRSWPDLWIGNSLVVLCLIGLLLPAGEIYYRFVYDTTDAFGLMRVTQDWMQEHVTINRLGFRDNIEYEVEREPGKRRITFIGDSFTAAHGIPDVENRFANRIRRAHPDWEIHVLATNGFDTGDERLLLDHLAGARYPFDIVVLVYCLNDIADIVPEWRTIQQKLYSNSRPPAIIDHSYLLNTWYYRLRSSRDPQIAQYYHFVLGAYAGTLFETQKARLAAIAKLVDESGGKLAVVTFPFLQDLDAGYEYASVHMQLERLWQELGVPQLDLLSTYAGQDSGGLVVNARDPHPNEAAHEQAARAIAIFLAGVVEQRR